MVRWYNYPKRFNRYLYLLLGIGIVRLIWPATTQAHGGGPFPVLWEEAAGPYIVSVLADPDVGNGVFIITISLSEGEMAPADTKVTVWVRPQTGNLNEVGYSAEFKQSWTGESFVVNVPFDSEGFWDVRLELDGAASRGDITFTVDVIEPSGRLLEMLAFFAPCLLLGGGWMISAIFRRKSVSQDKLTKGGRI